MNNKNEYMCPICGEGTLWTNFTDGFKWGRAYCDRCDCGGPEVRTGYDDNIDAPWRADAIKQFVDVVTAARTASYTIPRMASNNVVINITGGCKYCNGTNEQKPLFHENNYPPYTRMESCITVSESKDGKRYLIDVDLWDGANACAAFEINYCPMCGRKLERNARSAKGGKP